MRALKLANLGISVVIKEANCMTPRKWLRIKIDIQCGSFVLLLTWKMTLLDFFGTKFCKKCERGLACFQFFIWSTKMDTSWIRKKGLS